MKRMILTLLCGILPALLPASGWHASPAQAVSQTEKKTSFRITILKSNREPQAGIILRVGGEVQDYVADAQGVVTVSIDVEKYPRTATLYFPNEKNRVVKTITLSQSDTAPTLFVDSPEDLIRFKQNQVLMPVTGIISGPDGTVTGASVTIRGTGRSTHADKAGKFTIEADYTHAIVVRAENMENQTLHINQFLEHTDGPLPIYMMPKGSDRIYANVSRMPEFKGGRKAMVDFINRHLAYPASARSRKEEGVVVVQFIVEKDGSLTEPMIVRPLEAEMDAAALQVVKKMPHWTPGEEEGKAVRCKTSIPILFKPRKKPDSPAGKPQARPARLPQPLKQDSIGPDSLRTRRGIPDSLRLKPVRMDSIRRISPAPITTLPILPVNQKQ